MAPARVGGKLGVDLEVFGPNIDKLEQRGDVDALIEALAHKRQSVQDDAAAALGRLGDTRAVEPLIRVVEERGNEFSKCMDARMRFIEEHRGGRIYLDPREVPGGEKIEQAVDDAAWASEEASQALAPFARQHDLRTIEFLLGSGADAAATRPELAGCLSPDVLASILGSGSPTARAAAARSLTVHGDERSVEPLIAALGDEDSSVRLAAAAALGSRDDMTAESLGAQLQSEHPEVRGWAAGRLGERGDDAAAELLIGALDDAAPEVRTSAALALGRLGDPRAVEPLIGVLKQRGLDAREAFLALQEIGGHETEKAFAAGTPKVGDRVRVLVSGDVYAGIGSDRIEMGTGTVGEWRGTVVSVSEEGAGVRCDEVEGEVEGTAPGTTREMTLDPRHASELPDDPGHWCFEVKG